MNNINNRSDSFLNYYNGQVIYKRSHYEYLLSMDRKTTTNDLSNLVGANNSVQDGGLLSFNSVNGGLLSFNHLLRINPYQ